MPLESASYIDGLVVTNPTHTDPLSDADSHLRLLKSTIKATFPNVSAPITATAAGLTAAGSAFSGSGVAAIPANGSTASAELDLLGITTSGRVAFKNTATAAAVGALTVAMTDATDANSITAMTLTRAGALSATTSLNAPSVLQAGNPLLPSGVILLWSGAANAIPAGFVLCDGTNSTPDLRGVFVVGAGGAYSVAAAGGAASLTPTTASSGSHNHAGASGAAGSHTHSGTTDSQGGHVHSGATDVHTLTVAEIPAHTHEQQFGQGSGSGGTSWDVVGPGSSVVDMGITTQSTGSGAPHSHGMFQDGAHTHTVANSTVADHTHSISTDGSHTHTVTFDNRPPYYALCFIMKT